MDQDPTQLPPTSDFERLVLEARASGDFEAVLVRFVNTPFYTGIDTADEGPSTTEFRFRIVPSPQDGQPCIVVAESLEHLQQPAGGKAIRERGGRLLLMLRPEVGILVALGDGGFGLPPPLLAELRQRLKPKAATPPTTP